MVTLASFFKNDSDVGPEARDWGSGAATAPPAVDEASRLKRFNAAVCNATTVLRNMTALVGGLARLLIALIVLVAVVWLLITFARHLGGSSPHPSQIPVPTGTGHVARQETAGGWRSATTKRQREILAALEVHEPAQILDYELPNPVE